MERIRGQFAKKSTARLYRSKVERLEQEIEKQRRMISSFAYIARRKDNEILRLQKELKKHEILNLSTHINTLF